MLLLGVHLQLALTQLFADDLLTFGLVTDEALVTPHRFDIIPFGTEHWQVNHLVSL